MESQELKVRELLESFKTAMLVTKTREGMIGRPMAIASADNTCISFFSAFETEKVDEILLDPSVLVTMQKENSLSISVSGTALLSRDKSRLAAKWQEAYKVWFPGGVNDPQLTLIDVFPTRIEYWDTTGMNKVKYVMEAVRAYITGDKPVIEEGEQHGVVRV